MAITVPADPYTWPYDGDVVPGRTALLMVDWQHDFCGPGGYVDKMGFDIALTEGDWSRPAACWTPAVGSRVSP